MFAMASQIGYSLFGFKIVTSSMITSYMMKEIFE